MSENKTIYWYVMRAYKSEAKAEKKLTEYGLCFFIPKHYIVCKCHKETIRRLVPLIPSLLFIRASHEDILRFKQKCNFLQFAMWKKSTGTEYIIVPDRQMESFIKVASQYDENLIYYKPSEINLEKGIKVRIIGGLFDGVECIFLKQKNSKSGRIVVMLEGLLGVSVEINPDFIQILS